MASLGAVVRLRSNKWTRLLSHLRKTIDVSQKNTAARLPDRVILCYFSTKDRKEAQQLKTNPPVQSVTLDTGLNEDSDAFDELFAASREIFSRRFIKACEYHLTNWGQQVKELQNAGTPVDLNKIVSRSISRIVDFVLAPSSPPELRVKCLALLLSPENDGKLAVKMLHQTVDDVMTLPIKVVADIVQVLSTSSETVLRKETRTKLVTAVINHRCYEITPKYALFFMYELKELFDMRKISQQLRQHNKHERVGHKLEFDEAGVVESSKDEIDFETLDEELKSETQNRRIENPVFLIDENIPVLSINLEMRIIHLVNDLKSKDVARILIVLGKWRSRNETLLNAVVHLLNQADLSDFNFTQLNNLLYSLSILNIHNDDLLTKITTQLAQATPVSPSLACAVLLSLSHLRWKDEDLISKYLNFLADHVTELTLKEVHGLLMSLANLYAVPKNDAESEFVLKLASRVFTEDVTPADKVNCTWCLAVLLSLGAELGESMLQPEFAEQFSDVEDFQNQALVQKLKSINTALKFEVNGFSGPFLSEKFLVLSQNVSGMADRVLVSDFVNTLKKFVDLKLYVKLRESLAGGVVADAVLCADKSGEIRPLQSDNDESKQTCKIAIQLIPFSGVLNPELSPTGPYVMMSRHLKQLGYIPVQILYTDLKQSKTTLEKVTKIRDKIKLAVTSSLGSP